MNLAQILALILFIAMFILIVMDKIERHHVTLACGILTLAGVFGLAMRSMDAITETLNLRSRKADISINVRNRGIGL